ncbi:cold-responsive protein kinase 1-like isoform X3 [Lycium barbarum]|uniref:cold-responsive protein kinase 1-like isoform X3 n=1 Tax=Lycium barbarum TaxID=112863 RepID=UPI00293F5AC4|nr:cold-responsive protein kinase 1-like isoform X3 [Lycium barbarum]
MDSSIVMLKMAPEVMEQLHGYDFKADIWSFGITALELVHGHAPFSKYPPMKVLLMALQNAPPGLDYERDKKFSKSFKKMIASCLVKDPSKQPSAKKLLKHPFFKQARSNDYIARTLLEGLPALGDRMKALKRKEEDMLAQKKIPDGQKEEISQGIAKLQPFGRASCIYLGDEGSANIHPNLVNLHGCCIEGTELLLVYEYLENNSLARALFNSEKIQLILDWPTRVKICVGITKGLAYLHEESSLRIVHRDIKATNVLLDRDLNPKISDFRLARLTGDDNTHISTRVAGTIGYMAPEYALWGYLTYKADVYSFGIEKARGVISSPSHHPNTSINKPSVVTPIVPPPTTANVDDVDPLVSDDDRSPSPIH